MIIEISDEYLDPIREMPTITQNGKYKMKNGNVLAWLGKTDKLCVPVIMFRRAILTRAEQLGMIIHDPDTGTWRGADYDGD